MEYEEHWDEENDLVWELPLIKVEDFLGLESLSFSHSLEIWEAVVSAIYNAVDLGLERVPVFILDGTDSVVTLDRDQFESRLDEAQKYYSSHEAYELCHAIGIIKEKLK